MAHSTLLRDGKRKAICMKQIRGDRSAAVKDRERFRDHSPSGGNVFSSEAATEDTDKLWLF